VSSPHQPTDFTRCRKSRLAATDLPTEVPDSSKARTQPRVVGFAEDREDARTDEAFADF
jgi:hypothetical protein